MGTGVMGSETDEMGCDIFHSNRATRICMGARMGLWLGIREADNLRWQE